MKSGKRTCRNCGKEFISKRHKEICDECYEQIRQKLKRIQPHVCPVCGDRADKTYCCSICKQIANAVKSRERYEVYGRLHPKPTTPIGKCIEKARKLGITYGEYMAFRTRKRK